MHQTFAVVNTPYAVCDEIKPCTDGKKYGTARVIRSFGASRTSVNLAEPPVNSATEKEQVVSQLTSIKRVVI